MPGVRGAQGDLAAVQAFELGRARLLSGVVERERAVIDRLVDLGHESLHDRFLAAAACVRELETNLQPQAFSRICCGPPDQSGLAPVVTRYC